MKLTVRDVTRRRLASQFLTMSGPENAAEVVRALGAVQSQDYPGATWAVGQRTTGATDADLDREFSEGRILRTHVLRPTWHFVAPGDIRWMLELTAPRVRQTMTSYDRALELAPEVYRRTNAAIQTALRDGRHLTRAELRTAMERAGLVVGSGQRLGHIMLRAELDALVCSGPLRGKQFTYALLEERVPPAPAIERDEALAKLTRTYFTTRGPATLRDFAWWSGLAMKDARRGVEIVGRELERATTGGQDVWFSAARVPRNRPSAHLLPNYDEYFIGYADRSAIAQRLGETKLVWGGQALTYYVAFVDGQLVGQWRRVATRGAACAELKLRVRLNPSERARVNAAAGRFARFYGN